MWRTPNNIVTNHSTAAFIGFMLANHTSMAELFDHLLYQYDRIRSKNAFMDHWMNLTTPVKLCQH
jgi:hypothetical protein